MSLNVSHLVRRVSIEEAGIIVNNTSEFGPVKEQHKEKEFLQNVLRERSLVACGNVQE